VRSARAAYVVALKSISRRICNLMKPRTLLISLPFSAGARLS